MDDKKLTPFCEFLKKIIKNKEVVVSSVTKTVRGDALFKVLTASKAIKKEHKGGGYIWVVKKESVLLSYLSHHCPCDEDDTNKGERYNSIRSVRDSKSKARKATHIVFVRSNLPIVVNGVQKDCTTSEGEGYFLEHLSCEKVCFIENLESFKEEEKLLDEGWSCIYTVGRIGVPLLKKIKANEHLHYGDLDYVGLNEYARIKSVFGKADLYVPDNYIRDARIYGKKITTKQKAEDALLHLVKKDTKAKEILDFLHRENLFLEQEGYSYE